MISFRDFDESRPGDEAAGAFPLRPASTNVLVRNALVPGTHRDHDRGRRGLPIGFETRELLEEAAVDGELLPLRMMKKEDGVSRWKFLDPPPAEADGGRDEE
jgi:hypothetical protein